MTVATVERVRLERNRFGLRVDDRGRATIRDSVASGNNTNGFVVLSAGGLAVLGIEDSLASDNVHNGQQ
jgi:hypothetical protein